VLCAWLSFGAFAELDAFGERSQDCVLVLAKVADRAASKVVIVSRAGSAGLRPATDLCYLHQNHVPSERHALARE
jgi:hypothetical protein